MCLSELTLFLATSITPFFKDVSQVAIFSKEQVWFFMRVPLAILRYPDGSGLQKTINQSLGITFIVALKFWLLVLYDSP
ncbi:hypothetical protein DDZ16_17520 [Marinilabilia rubra]|uniref:Uncharacterized protein n=1 Tax=Marinilabilia rubra TaxID=2162893 RepID=A0A2U2B4M0_9BACT|nr:hypothetical protein DDZ16_17520 [Marinilabilia rubra]